MKDFRETLVFKLENKTLKIKEPLVWDYYLLEKSPEDFFKKFKLIWLNEEELNQILKKMFEIEQDLGDVLEEKKEKQALHIIIGKMVKYFWNNFNDFMNMTWDLFNKILKDFKKIVWEEKIENQIWEGRQGLQKLKKLF